MSKFQRPINLPFPQIYCTFNARDKESDNIVEYKIQELLEEDYERAADLLVRDFTNEESLCVCRGVDHDESALEEFRKFWMDKLKLKLSIGCYKNDGSNDLAGVTVLGVKGKSFKCDFEFKTDALKDVFGLLSFIESQYDPYGKYNIDKFLTDYGLVTNRDYRRRGIAIEFLKARVPILKALNLEVTSTIFTALGSQIAAIKANYEDVFVLKWSDIQQQFPTFDFSISNGEHGKIIDMKI